MSGYGGRGGGSVGWGWRRVCSCGGIEKGGRFDCLGISGSVVEN